MKMCSLLAFLVIKMQKVKLQTVVTIITTQDSDDDDDDDDDDSPSSLPPELDV